MDWHDRLWAKVDASGDCWEWTGGKYPNGYGRFQMPRGTPTRDRMAYRVVWEVLVGPIPEGLTIDHLCRNKICVNPDHLEPVTQAENNRRGYSPAGKRGRQKACKNGHVFTEANTYRVPNGRVCRTCQRKNAAAYYVNVLKHRR